MAGDLAREAPTAGLDFCRVDLTAVDRLVPVYLSDGYTLRQVWPLVVLAIALAATLTLLAGLRRGHSWLRPLRVAPSRSIFIVAFAFTGLGAMIGYITALSREPAVDAVLPGILSLVGAIAIYLIGSSPNPKENEPTVGMRDQQREAVAVAIMALGASLLVSAIWGAYQRDAGERFTERLETRLHKATVDARVKQCELQLEARLDVTRLELLRTKLRAKYFTQKFTAEAEAKAAEEIAATEHLLRQIQLGYFNDKFMSERQIDLLREYWQAQTTPPPGDEPLTSASPGGESPP